MNLLLKQLLEDMKNAMDKNSPEEYSQAFIKYQEALISDIKKDFEQYKETNDRSILDRRGIRQLTTEERKYWQTLIDASKKTNVKQEIQNINVAMPETTITEVYKELVQEHPLLGKINFQFSSFSTKWIVADHTKQTAAWGEITAEITKEIVSAFKEFDVRQNKLTAFFVLSKAMLDLGPEWVENYVKTVLYDSLSNALEAAIVSGDGANKMIGLDRDVHVGVAVSEGKYPQKEAVKLKSFRPKEYGTVLSKMAKTEKGNPRKFSSVLLICNMEDYLTKIMPATTMTAPTGNYVKDVFPFPTETVISNELQKGKAILALPNEYFAAIGTPKEGRIEYDDSVRFFEDQRAYSIKLYGAGRPYDNTIAILLDISELEEFMVYYKNASEVAA